MTRRTNIRILALTVAVVALATMSAACGSDSKNETTVPSDDTVAAASGVNVIDGAYTSTSAMGHTLVAGSSITLSFSGVQLSFNAGCNQNSGTYTLDDNVLTLTGDPASTMMACAPDLEAQNQWFTELLTGGAEVSESADTLTLTSGDVAVSFSKDDPGN